MYPYQDHSPSPPLLERNDSSDGTVIKCNKDEFTHKNGVYSPSPSKSHTMLQHDLELRNLRIKQLERELELERELISLRSQRNNIRDKLNSEIIEKENIDPKSTDTNFSTRKVSNSQIPDVESGFMDHAKGSMSVTSENLIQLLISNLELPKKEIMTFSGNPMEYWAFIRNFESTVCQRTVHPESLLNYLIQYCSGEAREAISHCVILEPEKGYREARRILKERFGENHVIAHKYINHLLDGPIIHSRDASALSKLAHEMRVCEVTLTQLDYTADLNASRTLEAIVSRLPSHIQYKWVEINANILRNGREPSFRDLTEFVEDRAYIANSRCGRFVDANLSKPNDKLKVDKHKDRTDKGRLRILATETTEQRTNVSQFANRAKCILCKEDHYLDNCPIFVAKPMDKRRQFVKEMKLCNLCLKQNHMAKDCRCTLRCKVDGCGMRHHSLMHFKSANEGMSENAVIMNYRCQNDAKVAFSVIPILVRYGKNEVQTCAFLDSGADTSLVKTSLLRRLGMRGKPVSMQMSTLNSSNNISGEQISNLTIYSLDESISVTIDKLFSVEQLPTVRRIIPTTSEIEKWKHLSGIPWPNTQQTEVTMLIGCNVPAAHRIFEVRMGQQGEPYGLRTAFGWTLFGPLRNAGMKGMVNHLHTSDELENQLRSMYNQEFSENRTDERPMSMEDKRALQLMTESIHLVGGHYEVGLPWKKDRNLPDNKMVAYRRLQILRAKLKRDPDLQRRYVETMNQYLNKQHAELVSSNELNKPRWFLPHHPVINPKKPDKLRIVFDCASEFHNVSLNKVLYSGPDLTNALLGVLIRFRREEVAITADIESMFHQVLVPEDDRSYLSFLWWLDYDKDKEPKIFQMRVHLFGATSSPSCANLALRRTVEDNEALYDKQTTKIAREQFYVDDLLASLPSVSEAIRTIDELKRMLKQGGFNLTKWTSNKLEVLENVPEADRAKEVINLNLSDSCNPRTLGIEWNIRSDQFQYTFRCDGGYASRRKILSFVASIYDPMGFLSPLLLLPKLILQQACRSGLSWDDRLSKEDSDKWIQWQSSLSEIEQLKIPRCLAPGGLRSAERIELHCFCDASEFAYGAVVYLRVLTTQGAVHCSLVLGKARVSPLRRITIPRMELVAAVTSVKLGAQAMNELKIPVASITFWTDSMIVLHYINNISKRFEPFVINRLEVIHKLSSPEQWRYIDSKRNPADYASRGLTLRDTIKWNRWLNGPEFLWGDDTCWPQRENTPSVELFPQNVSDLNVNTLVSEPGFLERFSSCNSYMKLLRVMAWCIRFKNLFMRIINHKSCIRSKYLSAAEITEAEHSVIKFMQHECFPNELKVLKDSFNPHDDQQLKQTPIVLLKDIMNDENSRKLVRKRLKQNGACLRKFVNRSSTLRKLCPFVYNGIIRVGGRLQWAPLPFESRHPIILPAKHFVTRLIVQHYHVRSKHMGLSYVQSEIREKFWIIRGTSVIRSVLAECFDCKRYKSRPCQQLMAPLPSSRLQPFSPPFSSVGLDYFGPFHVKRGRSLEKRYGCLFTCFTTRAIHIEVAHTLSTDSFLCAFSRFVARRGRPQRIFSDNGSNFHGAESEIKDILGNWDEDKITKTLAENGCEWIFNPPKASHRGGVWERIIRSIRSILLFVLNERPVNDETLLTFLVETESILNNRPLIKAHDDANEFNVLSPNKMLLLHHYQPPIMNCDDKVAWYNKRWREAQKLTNLFWKRWISHYLPTLQTRTKWFRASRNIQEGDLVLIVDKDMPRGHWSKAIVMEAPEDRDGRVRTVKLRTKTGTLIRDVRNLCLLEESLV